MEGTAHRPSCESAARLFWALEHTPVLKLCFRSPRSRSRPAARGAGVSADTQPPRSASSPIHVARAGQGCAVPVSRGMAGGSSDTGADHLKAGSTVLLTEERLGRFVWG